MLALAMLDSTRPRRDARNAQANAPSALTKPLASPALLGTSYLKRVA